MRSKFNQKKAKIACNSQGIRQFISVMKYWNNFHSDLPLGLLFVMVAQSVISAVEDGPLNPLNGQHIRVVWVNTIKITVVH